MRFGAGPLLAIAFVGACSTPNTEVDAALATIASCVGEQEGYQIASKLTRERDDARAAEHARDRAARGEPFLHITRPNPFSDPVAENDPELDKLPFTTSFNQEQFNAVRQNSRELTLDRFTSIFNDEAATSAHRASGNLSPQDDERKAQCAAAGPILLAHLRAEGLWPYSQRENAIVLP